MKKRYLYLILSLFASYFFSCQQTPHKSEIPLIAKCDTCALEKKNTLFAFVGEKINVQRLPNEKGSMDYGFIASYRILVPVYGVYSGDTISFSAYDHYGWPAFAAYKHALLFVSEDSGKYYHEKYQFFDVYPAKNGRWASSYKAGDYDHVYNLHTPVKLERIDFMAPVKYPLYIKRRDGRIDTLSYLAPYYLTQGDSALAVYGNYIEDLFALKKSGVLAARGLFDKTPEQEALDVQPISLEDVKRPYDAEDLRFIAFWKTFASAITEPGLKKFQAIALDSLLVCDTLLSTRAFVNRCFAEVINKDVLPRISDTAGKTFTWAEASWENLTSSAQKQIVMVGRKYRFRQVEAHRSTDNQWPPEIVFDFIETRKGYRFYGIDHHWFINCCR
jgi:hypothetical protein